MKHKPSLSLLLAAVFTLPFLSGCVPAIVTGVAVTAVGVNVAGSNLPVGTQVDDATIRLKAINSLNHFSADVKKNSNIEIIVFNRIVMLLGQVPTAAIQKGIAIRISHIPGVRMVYNQLTVGPKISYGTYATDTMVTARVKANFVGKVNPMHFKVVTENGVVYLLAITTQAEGDQAAYIAAHTRGVRQVVKAYSIIPETNNTQETATPQPAQTSEPASSKPAQPSDNNSATAAL